MTRLTSSGFIAIAGISALANVAHATQPPCAGSDASLSTACGSYALANNTGHSNTAVGDSALRSNTTSPANTAIGISALASNTGGSYNTAAGGAALVANTSGSYNTASGAKSLWSNTTGTNNVASGFDALRNNTEGGDNTALGTYAMSFNNLGNYNSASGYGALSNNTSGNSNTATGVDALYSNVTGDNNTATGYYALFHNTGTNNIAMGYQAGFYPTGSNNIDIGNAGALNDNGFIRIGTGGTQKGAFIAGITSSKVTGSAVYVTTGGRLGVLASSERYKTAIVPMGPDTTKMQNLRPVEFHLKSDPKGAVQYGLIAEEVAKVYPELVIRDERGRIEGVRYDELAPMLLNEVQKQATEIATLRQQLAGIQAALVKLQPKDALVAQR